ncbi:hypothetical protein G6O67_003259 [Ophiocordyceps sinensis]|uniref:Acyl-CoA N-acyltransferase n=1 Tax=Ophiocordyceps sinensis TaxID=72228 RepID=A0A8H4PVY7_9HYPO|nr:hypothetical protein G6O67_003259 [Ophiocordyceps sinensis]
MPASPDNDIVRHCGAMRDWLSPPRSPMDQKPQVQASAAACKAESTSDRHGLVAQTSLPGLKESRRETWDNASLLSAEGNEPEIDETAVQGADSENADSESRREHSNVVESRAASSDSIRQGSQHSLSTWDVSDIEVVDAENKGAADPHGGASLRDAGPSVEATVPSLSVGAEDDLIGDWFNRLVVPSAAACRRSWRKVLSCNNALDPGTGDIIPAIEHPETLQTVIHGPYQDHRDIGWRQMNMTSELQIVREMKSRQRLADHMRASRERHEQVAKPATPAPEENAWPNAHCILRPVRPDDFSQIADIMNLEGSAAFPQIFDSQAVDTTDVDWIYKRCQKTKRPFIVAIPIEEDMMDRSKWPPNSDRAYREYVEFKKTCPSPPPPVVGFALVTEMRLGFPLVRCVGSRYSAQVRVLVHPQYRQKTYGTALLDRVLLSVSPRHRSIIDYEWKCDDPERIYEHPVDQNDRQYARLYVEVFCGNKMQTEYTWRAEMLGKFNFQEVGHLRNAIRTEPGRRSEWLDLVLWEFEALDTAAIKEKAR